MSENPLVKLLSYILPSEFNEYFDLTDVKEEERDVEKILHLYLHEKNIQPDGHTELSPNGFYPESCINHFPLNEHLPFCTYAVAVGRTVWAGRIAEIGS